MKGIQDLVLIGEIDLQAKIALRAAQRLLTTHENFDKVEMWCSIQSILVGAGNVSKILWPNKKYELRGELLRQILNVEEHNPLSSRKFRNHFEHYDERVEEWFRNSSGGPYVDLAMNPSWRGSYFDFPMVNPHKGIQFL